MYLSLWYHQVTQVSRYVYHYWLKEEGLTWPVLDLVNPIIRLEPFMSPWVYSCAWIYSRASSWWIKTIFQYGGISFSSPNVELNSKCPNKDILPAFMHKYNTDVRSTVLQEALSRTNYSRTCIKRHRNKWSPSIKWSVFKVLKITSLDVL